MIVITSSMLVYFIISVEILPSYKALLTNCSRVLHCFRLEGDDGKFLLNLHILQVTGRKDCDSILLLTVEYQNFHHHHLVLLLHPVNCHYYHGNCFAQFLTSHYTGWLMISCHSLSEISHKHRPDSQWLWISHYLNVKKNRICEQVLTESFYCWICNKRSKWPLSASVHILAHLWIKCIAHINSLGLSFTKISASKCKRAMHIMFPLLLVHQIFHVPSQIKYRWPRSGDLVGHVMNIMTDNQSGKQWWR